MTKLFGTRWNFGHLRTPWIGIFGPRICVHCVPLCGCRCGWVGACVNECVCTIVRSKVMYMCSGVMLLYWNKSPAETPNPLHRRSSTFLAIVVPIKLVCESPSSFDLGLLQLSLGMTWHNITEVAQVMGGRHTGWLPSVHNDQV